MIPQWKRILGGSQAEGLLLSVGLLDYGGDMKPGNIGMGVVI